MDGEPEEITLKMVHEDLRTGFADLKATLIAGFRSLPTREQSDEMIRLLRENNRLQEERLAQLDVRIREQHLETQQVLHGVADGQRALLEGQRALGESLRALAEGQRTMSDEIRSLSADIKALIARLDALIKDRGDGSPAS